MIIREGQTLATNWYHFITYYKLYFQVNFVVQFKTNQKHLDYFHTNIMVARRTFIQYLQLKHDKIHEVKISSTSIS